MHFEIFDINFLMTNIYLKYDNMYKNGMNYAIKFTNDHVITSKYYVLSHPPT